jgi:MFS family permease
MRDMTELPELADRTLGRSADRSRWMALVVLCTGMLMIVLDVTIVNVALPSIQADLGFSQTGLAWVINAYLIAFGGLLLLAGRLGDLAERLPFSETARRREPGRRAGRRDPGNSTGS